MMRKILIGEMSWKEFEENMKDNDLIIVPVGALEQHGHHNPLGTDTYIAEKAAFEVGEKTKFLVAPVMPYGYVTNVRNFSGTISLDPQTYRKLLKSYCESFIKHGVKRILFINGHGGNNDILSMVSRDLFEEHECFCMYTMWWESLPEINKKWPCDDHGGYYETSMMMAVNEDIIDMAKAKEAPNIQLTEKLKYNCGWRFNEANINVPWDEYSLQKIGNSGNPPEGANAKLGKEMLEKYVEFNVELAEEMKKINFE
jgi:creatinine amidohydrolase